MVLKSPHRQIQSRRRMYDTAVGGGGAPAVVLCELADSDGELLQDSDGEQLLDNSWCGTATDVPQSEADALIAFYNATGGDSWTDNTGWLVEPLVADWFGVTVAGGHVTIIEVSSNNLVGNAGNTLTPLASNLTELLCYDNLLTGLNVSGLTNLTYLDCSDNSISVLDVSTLVNLTELYCYNNSISVLNVSALTNLTWLYCNGNNISVLNVSALTSLVGLSCYNNSISVLDVSALVDLVTLYCHSNSISVLDVSTAADLWFLLCQDNGMSQAQVDAVLWNVYQSSTIPRTQVGGQVNISGTNAAPSGVFQPAAACPVTGATPGKEIANELLNDGCGVGFNVWATVTTS